MRPILFKMCGAMRRTRNERTHSCLNVYLFHAPTFSTLHREAYNGTGHRINYLSAEFLKWNRPVYDLDSHIQQTHYLKTTSYQRRGDVTTNVSDRHYDTGVKGQCQVYIKSGPSDSLTFWTDVIHIWQSACPSCVDDEAFGYQVWPLSQRSMPKT